MTSADELPELPGIDIADGLKRVMHKVSLYQKVLHDFHARFHNATTLIRNALAAGDFDTARRQAHSTKGLAGTIGALKLQDLARDLEEVLSTGQMPDEALFGRFDAELATVIDGIGQGFGIARPAS